MPPWGENHFLDDGAYLVTKILIKMATLRREGKDLRTCWLLREPAEAAEVRLPITEEDFRARGEALIAALEEYAKAQGWAIAPDNREGLRSPFRKGEGKAGSCCGSPSTTPSCPSTWRATPPAA